MSLHEHMEHAGHAGHEGGHGHGGGGIGKFVGITMAILGVLLALGSAMVGGARTELIATMVRQTNTSLLYTSVATKYRMLQAQLQQLHALLPSDPEAFKHTQLEVDTLARSIEQSPAAKGQAQVGPLAKVVRLESESILNSVVPTREDVVRFAELIRGFDKEREAAHEWAESYDESIEAYSEAAEHYEWGQLAAEIGIVIASIALLLSNRLAWMGSCALGLASITLIGWTFVNTHGALHHADEKISRAQQAYAAINLDAKSKVADERLLEDIERTGGDAPVVHGDGETGR